MTQSPLHAATRDAGLARLSAFVPRAGGLYGRMRNHDLGHHENVSGLSPWISHRAVTEEEVLRATLAIHRPAEAGKFVQEVFWRLYWKGWLEMRPGVWAACRAGVARAQDRLATESGLRRRWEAACTGQTGIEPFDHWAQELTETGYLHNHARMWFASIWIFTLGLPWELGADFFLRHLLDGDAASNTLGWRWVAGIQTRGKVYAATAENIAAFTGGRFRPVRGLAADPAPIGAPPDPPRGPLPAQMAWDGAQAETTGLLLTPDDLSPDWLFAAGLRVQGAAVLMTLARRSPLAVGPLPERFSQALALDALDRLPGAVARGPVSGDPAMILDWARAAGLTQIVTPRPPVGPGADALADLAPRLSAAGIALVQPIRAIDLLAWPHATHGFFRFRGQIPGILTQIGL